MNHANVNGDTEFFKFIQVPLQNADMLFVLQNRLDLVGVERPHSVKIGPDPEISD